MTITLSQSLTFVVGDSGEASVDGQQQQNVLKELLG